jgi:16S rRNA (guanine1516-N2)-methyltransferase
MKAGQRDHGKSPSIAVEYAEPVQKDTALELAAELLLPLAIKDEPYDLILRCTGTGLELYRPGDPMKSTVRAEFVKGAAGYRRSRGGREMLIRALGKGAELNVLDATGGLGRDAFIMAAHGCRVRIAEKNPVVAALLEDGLQRASGHPGTRDACSRISLYAGDSRDLLQEDLAGEDFDVVYLDPMFPDRRKSAQVKKEMQLLQQLTGPDDEDPGALLPLALEKAGKRVVVKRPKGAPSLPGPEPDYSLGGRSIRFDVYLTGR